MSDTASMSEFFPQGKDSISDVDLSREIEVGNLRKPGLIRLVFLNTFDNRVYGRFESAFPE